MAFLRREPDQPRNRPPRNPDNGKIPRMQLDLFLHSADVSLRNAVVDALQHRDPGAMRAAIDQLRAHFPNDDSLAGFERLFTELLSLGQLALSPTAIAGQLERIDRQLLPLLKELIGNRAAQCWLAPTYTDLARSVAGQAFVRNLATTHAAALFLKAGALPEARAALTEIPSWRRIPEPLAWMLEIALRENKPTEFWPLLAELAWIAPAVLDTVLTWLPESRGQSSSSSVLRLYREFGARAELEADDENQEAAWFPAWLLVEHAELLPLLRGADARAHNSRPARTAALLFDLLTGERHGAAPAMAAQRRQLRDLSAPLFARYMARR